MLTHPARSRLALFCLFSLCTILACGEAQEDLRRNSNAMEFAVDPELLGERFASLTDGFSIHAPAGWETSA